MARRSRQGRHYESVHIDVVPMVDCMLVLVIFLMVSSVFVAAPGVEVERPDVSGGETVDRNFLLLAITADDRIFFDGQEIQLEQVAPAVKQAAFSRDQALIIQADKRTSHGMFARVYSEGKKAGISNVQFATARSDRP
jgi:biopolymer transport protein ExbD